MAGKSSTSLSKDFTKSARGADGLIDSDKILENWERIAEYVEKVNKESQEEFDVLKELTAEETKYIKEKNKLQNQEAIFKAKIAKLEADAQKKGEKADKAKLKMFNEELKYLKKKQTDLKAIQEIEQKTQALKDKADAISSKFDARKEYNSQIKSNQGKGKEMMQGSSIFSKDFWNGAGLALTGGLTGGAGVVKALDTMTKALSDFTKKLDKSIEEIAAYKSDWDTRLFGTGSNHTSLTDTIAKSLGASPFAKQSEVLKNIDKAVDAGIAYNVEQRAFLETIRDDIAGTFDAFDSQLLEIIRVQQSDSTAARLGMEASLNAYLNSMYSNTEYLNSASDTVTSALYQATSLLSSEESIGFEYQVQKWLGSLYSVGFSNTSSIATALGQLASGDISGTNSDAGKLLVMAASRAGLNYSEMLTKGIDESDVNILMRSMVEYLEEIANSNKVVQTQYAALYGLKTSDIQAAKNLSNSVGDVYGSSLNYSGAVGMLNTMASTIASRMSQGEMMTNVLDNLQYTLSTSIANNPILYGIWSMSNLLDDLVGGINIPFISAMGFGVDLETTVADLMKVGALGTSLLSSMGNLISGTANNTNGLAGVLSALGVSSNASYITRGNGGLAASISGASTSVTSYKGNTSGNDVYESSMASADDKKTEAQASSSTDGDQVDQKVINNNILSIYELLEKVTTGALKFTVQNGSKYTYTQSSSFAEIDLLGE